jgi:flagellar motor protein MotB
MRVKLLRFDSYPGGVTDFNAIRTLPQNPAADLDASLMSMAESIAGVAGFRSSIVIVGHSDRQDRPDFSCDQRRQSEIDASRERAHSAWDYCRETISEVMPVMPPIVDWWDTSDRMTWALVYAAAGMLQNGSANEAERLKNRRVDILISHFAV